MSGGCRFCDGTVAENVGLCSDCVSLLVEQNSNSLQQLKAEISAMISKWKHCCELGVDWYEVELSDYERLQKLSAV